MMKQDKGRVVAIMDKAKYHQKCLMILENGNFKTLDHDLTKKHKKKYNEFYGKLKTDYRSKNTYVYTRILDR